MAHTLGVPYCGCAETGVIRKDLSRSRLAPSEPSHQGGVWLLKWHQDIQKVGLNLGYNRLFLAPESRYITTFSTHMGLKR